ncbi:MAG: PAS domain-containing protein [candidate division WOR-3 bacterium]|nr:PAS domain-containing protein [candidate division WOR-3 bacterium]
MKAKILVVSPDSEIVKEIKNILEGTGHVIKSVNTADSCLNLCKSEHFDIIFVDTHIPTLPFNLLIPDLKKVCTESEIILITGHTVPEALVKLEAYQLNNFLILPLNAERLKLTLNRALRQLELLKENRRLLLTVTAAKKEWEATVDAIEDPIFVTDFDYKILRANLATFQMLGKGVYEVIGKKCYELLHCANEPVPDCPGKKARDSGEPVTDTLSFKGIKKRMTCSVYPQVFADGGGLVHYLHEPIATTEQEAQIMAKYERLFDDGIIPIVVVSAEDYKITDANQSALKLLKYDPENLVDMDWENIFARDVREVTIKEILNQITAGRAIVKSKLLDRNFKEIEVEIYANPVEVGNFQFLELFLVTGEKL